MAHGTDEEYRLFRQSHKELHADLWRLIERRESRLCWRWLGDHDSEGHAQYGFEHEDTLYTQHKKGYNDGKTLGMNIVRTLVTQLDGEIAINSGDGVRVTIDFPTG